MQKENNNNSGAGGNQDVTPAKSPLAVESEDQHNPAPTGGDDNGGNDEDGEQFHWGFEDLFKTPSEDTQENISPAEATGGDQPTKVDILEQEVSRLREEARVRSEFELLEKKYLGKDGFPAVDKQGVMDFLQKDFGKMSPLEIGYILSNFKTILSEAKASVKKEVETQYSPEVTAQKAQADKQSAMTQKMAEISQQLMRRYGVRKEEQ